MKYFAILLLTILCIVHLKACWDKNHKLRMPTKVMLLPMICVAYCLWAKRIEPLVVAGLLLGCVGDAFLLCKNQSPLFALGMLAFGLGHICYMRAIALHFGFAACTPLRVILMAFGYALYLAAVYVRARRFVSTKLMAGAIGYMLFLCGTSACALLSLLRAPGLPTALLFAGSLLFILSDTILSWTVCVQQEDSNFAVMLTYILAQASIAAAFAM